MNDKIINVLLDADQKDKLQLVSAITTISIERLRDIMNHNEMTPTEEAMLSIHV